MRRDGTVDIAQLMDEGRFSPRQLAIVALCGFLMMLDGYDSIEIGYVAPSIMQTWHLQPATLSLLFTATGIAQIVGSLFIGPLADRYGRRMMMLGGTVVMGLGSLASAWSAGPTDFLVWRIVCGLGLAVVMPNAIALGAEYAPTRVRSFACVALYSGFAIGAAIGAEISARLIPAYGWPSVLIVGGIVPLVMALVILATLPESIRFLVLHAPASPQIARELRRIDPRWKFAGDVRFNTSEKRATSRPVRELFAEGRALATLLLWLVFTMNILEVIFLTNWSPTILRAAGVPLDRALHSSSIMQVGALLGALAMARAMDKWGPARALVPAHLLGVFGVGLFGFSIGHGALIYVIAAVMGAGVLGSQTGMNGFAPIMYPTAIRATGISSALGIGRFGTILGPILGGIMVARGLSAETIFLLGAIPPVIATAGIFALWRIRCRAAESGAEQPADVMLEISRA